MEGGHLGETFLAVVHLVEEGSKPGYELVHNPVVSVTELRAVEVLSTHKAVTIRRVLVRTNWFTNCRVTFCEDFVEINFKANCKNLSVNNIEKQKCRNQRGSKNPTQ